MSATIWVLLMVMLTPSESSYLLKKFDSQGECVSEEKRIGDAMATAYPGDESFRIECREKKINIVEASTQQLNYTELISAWIRTHHHSRGTGNFKVMAVSRLHTDNGPHGVLLFQVYITSPYQIDSYILMFSDDKVTGWSFSGHPDDDESEEDTAQKDAA